MKYTNHLHVFVILYINLSQGNKFSENYKNNRFLVVSLNIVIEHWKKEKFDPSQECNLPTKAKNWFAIFECYS